MFSSRTSGLSIGSIRTISSFASRSTSIRGRTATPNPSATALTIACVLALCQTGCTVICSSEKLASKIWRTALPGSRMRKGYSESSRSVTEVFCANAEPSGTIAHSSSRKNGIASSSGCSGCVSMRPMSISLSRSFRSMPLDCSTSASMRSCGTRA